MQDLSTIFKNVRIVDGSGRPSFEGDVGIAGDRIAAVGKVDTGNARIIEGNGQVLAPAFIDIHTHYDPQLCWDDTASPSPEHGVGSLVIGNCSISLAPVHTDDRNRVIRLFGSVEDMEGKLLEQAVPFSWNSYGEYLDYMGRRLGPNVVSLVGHAMLRLYVMGAAAQERPATDEEIARMCALLEEALDCGAVGLSLTFAHLDEKGNILPSSYADDRELGALYDTLARARRGVMEVAPPLINQQRRELTDRLGQFALHTGVTTYISPLLQIRHAGDNWRRLLDLHASWCDKGAPLYAQTQVRPLDMLMALDQGSSLLAKSPIWRRVLDLSPDARMDALRDEAQRAALERDFMANPVHATASVKRSATNPELVGRTVAEIAEDRRAPFYDTFIALALDDELSTQFRLDTGVQDDEDAVIQLLDHPSVHIGAGDAGAHINQFAGAGDTSYLLERYVRERGDMSLERAVQRLTSEPAAAWGIEDRGEIAVGKFADLVLFDPDRVTRGGEEWVEDIPGGFGRYVRHPTGYAHLMVNGGSLMVEGEYTDNRSGRIV